MASKVGDETIRNLNLVPLADPLLGPVVEQYRVESFIGSGAMGMVYRAVHQVIGKAVAIKVLKADFADDPEMVQRLVREARTVNAIRHPAIVDIFGFGTLPRTEQPYIVMDLLEGVPLDEYLKLRAPMRARDVAPFLDELLSALSAAHAVGVIHRDLKPGNVFVESKPDGQSGIKVIDFGLAKQSSRANGSVKPTNPGTLLGTPAFMAPEQVMGAKVTPATDLYAVGGIAYQMLTNHLPHEAPSAIEVLSQKMQHDPVRPKQWQNTLDDELDAWVMNLLSREPEKRMQDAEEARRSLRRIIDGRTSSGSGIRNNPPPKPTASLVPKREWGEAKTVVGEETGSPSTEDGMSPFAKTATSTPVVELQLDPTLSPSTRFQSSRSDVMTQAVDPEEILKAQPRSSPTAAPLPPAVVVKPQTAKQPLAPVQVKSLRAATSAAEPMTLNAPSRLPLYIALGTAIVALLLGLAFLLSQR